MQPACGRKTERRGRSSSMRRAPPLGGSVAAHEGTRRRRRRASDAPTTPATGAVFRSHGRQSVVFVHTRGPASVATKDMPDETNLYEQAVVNRARDRGHGIIPDLYSASPAAPPRGGGRAMSRVAAPASLPRAGSRCPSSFHEVRLG